MDWDEMQNLMILSFRANVFEGNIPMQLCQLKSLKILNLALNYLSGTIPRCINNFLEMSKIDSVRSYIYDPYITYTESLQLTWKGRASKFSTVLPILKALDLSSNKLSGGIPREITSLRGLYSLNLSRNHLAGTIPDGIGDFEFLESLDLSRNELSCTIPASFINLTFLELLNLSRNRLSGKIPRGMQFDTFDATSYMGNHNLCGHPLKNDCLINGSHEDPECHNEESEGTKGDTFQVPSSLYISVGLGFVTGFWGLWGTLLIKTSWRHAYFRFLGNLYDKIYVIIVVYANRLARKFHNHHVAE